MDHLPYSPYMAPTDFWLVPELWMEAKCFLEVEAIKSSVKEKLTDFPV
jgi:hypothetical protein